MFFDRIKLYLLGWFLSLYLNFLSIYVSESYINDSVHNTITLHGQESLGSLLSVNSSCESIHTVHRTPSSFSVTQGYPPRSKVLNCPTSSSPFRRTYFTGFTSKVVPYLVFVIHEVHLLLYKSSGPTVSHVDLKSRPVYVDRSFPKHLVLFLNSKNRTSITFRYSLEFVITRNRLHKKLRCNTSFSPLTNSRLNSSQTYVIRLVFYYYQTV